MQLLRLCYTALVTTPEEARLRSETQRRRTFAIISHPDAGKTTLTEKLLLHGGAIHLAGTVKARGQARHVTSDWMELERQRGIPIFTFVNKLDRPGREPIDLLHEVEEVLGIRTVPVTWPVGQGADFGGVATLFEDLGHAARRIVPELPAVDPKLRAHVAEEIELVAHAGDALDHARVLRDRKSTRLNSSHEWISYA